MGVSCKTIQLPSSPTSFNGILDLVVTGGTPPYKYYWSTGDRTQIISGLPYGSYQVVVVDYYGDYTASTICTLAGPTPSITPTRTPTMTPTPTFVAPNLCFVMTINPNVSSSSGGGTTTYGPYQFVPNGVINGRQRWTNTSNNMNLTWNSTLSRWEISGWNFGGTPVSNSQSLIPLSGWGYAGNGSGTVSVTQGNCPSSLPLRVSTEIKNSTCNNSCDGALFVSAVGGIPPYQYSINGVTYQTSNIFNNICPSTFILYVKDTTSNPPVQQSVTIGNNNVVSVYRPVISKQTQIISQNEQVTTWSLTTSPALPVGAQLSVDFTINVNQQIQGPWASNDPDQTFSIICTNTVTKNSTDVTAGTSTPSINIIPRPNCSPSETEVTSFDEFYSVILGNGDTLTGTTVSIIESINCAQDTCVSTGVQNVELSIGKIRIINAPCATTILNQPVSLITNHTYINYCS
jgi:hypothetical protein